MVMPIRNYRSNYSLEEVEAVQLTADNVKELAAWCDGFDVEMHDALNHEDTYVGINVPTDLGRVRASEGDWIIKSSRGSFYTVRPGAFDNAFQIT